MAIVSVIVPVYNTEHYLNRCLQSLRQQTLQDIEIICVDDGSTDNSLEVLKRHSAEEPRICILSGENASAGAARNKGMKRAKGEYLMFLDSDDFFEPDLLENMYMRMRIDDLDMVVCRATQYIQNERKDRPANNQAPPELWSRFGERTLCPRMEMPDKLFQMIAGTPWNKMWKKSFIDKHKLEFQPIVNGNDTYFVYSSFLLAERVALVKKPLVHWRRHNSSLSNGYDTYPTCYMDALLGISKQVKGATPDIRVWHSFLNYAVTVIVWRLSRLSPEVRVLVRKSLAERIEPQLHLLDYISLYLAEKPLDTKDPLQQKMRVYTQLTGLKKTYVVLLDLRERRAWHFLRKLKNSPPKPSVNAIIGVKHIEPEKLPELNELEKHLLGSLIVRYDRPEGLASGLEQVPQYIGDELIQAGLLCKRKLSTDQLARLLQAPFKHNTSGSFGLLRLRRLLTD